MRRRLAGWAAVGAAATILAVSGWVAWPLPRGLIAPQAVSSLALEDRSGMPLRLVRGEAGRLDVWVRLAEMDPRLIQAFVATEDRRFYEHPGVDLRAIGRAARDNLRAGRAVSGASTITMQLARLLVGSGHAWPGKLEQVLWALRLERHLSKQEILEQYLNRVPLGQGANGIGSGARLYFNAAPGQLSLSQAALLAGIARAPSNDNPLVSEPRAVARRTMALTRMVAAGYASPEEAARAATEPLRSPPAGGAPFLAPHFTVRLLRQADSARRSLAGNVRTSLDLSLQRAVEAEVRHAVAELRERLVQHAAAVVLDNGTGEILAWVGSPDFWADTAGQVDMVASPRQPGSALKPFVYGLAFDRGLTAASILPDVPRDYQTPTGPYRPRNYDRRFHGPVRAREALASSYNVPAVELSERLGVASVLHTLQVAGFTSLSRDAEHYGLGLALGNGDVTLLELANGYRALVNGGLWRPVQWLAIPVATGETTRSQAERRVVSAGAAALVLDILADPGARIPGFGAGTVLELSFLAAVKTGTSRHFTDNWAVITTARFTVATWAGNFSGRTMRGVSGVAGAAPLAHRIALVTAQRYPPGDLPALEAVGARPFAICRLSGRRAGPDCPVATEWFLAGGGPGEDRCDWHRGGGHVELPADYAEWAASGSERPPLTAAPVIPIRGGFQIVSPRDGDRYSVPPGTDPRYATIALQAAGVPSGAAVRWWVDGRPVARSRWALVSGPHVVRAEVSGLAAAEVRIEVTP